MALYINIGNNGFRTTRNSEYVDKSGLIGVVNRTLDTRFKFTCVSRCRRFGKSMAAEMLCAYYDKSCDSRELFADLEIAKDPTFETHLNKYSVIFIDMSNFTPRFKDTPKIVDFIEDRIKQDVLSVYHDVEMLDTDDLMDCLVRIHNATGEKFVLIIDEWDAICREFKPGSEAMDRYVTWLRRMFKSVNAADVFAGVYMTGILPIKKYKTESALNNFREYSMVVPGKMARYFGFTKDEVKTLCEKYSANFDDMERWYDGYRLADVGSVYNPNSVMKAIRYRTFESYWEMSAAADSLLRYVSLDYEGLADIVREVMADRPVRVNTRKFKNDTTSFNSRDDVLTLLIHFGYFNYDPESETIRIPNEEIRIEFGDTLRDMKYPDTIRRVQESDKLIQDVVYMRAEDVAKAIEKIHREEFEPRHYNNEQSLRSVIKLAFFAYKDKFTQLEELAGGEGYADIVYLPKKAVDMPILVIELKWNKTAETALDQIRRKHYPDVLQNRDEQILLVGISYDKDDPDKKHTCIIEEL